MHAWDAQLYSSKHAFIPALGRELLELLEVREGDHVLDVGCGDGRHAAELVARGVRVTGIDADPAMVRAAREACAGADIRLGDARDLTDVPQVDAVLSNATLHWVKPPERAARAMARVLKPGGRLVVEFGGAGNVAQVCDALVSVLEERGVHAARELLPWYFPSLGEYAQVLEAHGFRVTAAWLFERPTALEPGDAGLREWLTMFVPGLFAGFSAAEREAALCDVEHRLRPRLFRSTHWELDYVRLRIVAVKPL